MNYLNTNRFIIFITFLTPFCRYSEGEIRFNLMAIVSDRKMIYEQKIAELQRQLAEVCGHTHPWLCIRGGVTVRSRYVWKLEEDI